MEEHLNFYINLGYKKPDAIEIVAKRTQHEKNEVYKFSTEIPVEKVTNYLVIKLN